MMESCEVKDFTDPEEPDYIQYDNILRYINVLSRAQVLHVLQQLGLDQHCEQCTQQAKF